jgi:PAS domain S-box-containing protein
MHSFLQARLSRRIVLWVFASILLIEAIILLPSIHRRQQELLTHLRDLSAARVEGSLVATQRPIAEAELLSTLERLAVGSVVRGGALYRQSGELVGQFGEAPTLTFQQVQAHQTSVYHKAQARYDATWSMQPLAGYVLVIRHDAASVQRELVAFAERVALLVTIISVFVTLVTLIGLERILITPILRLRNDLLKVGETIREQPLSASDSLFESLKLHRTDELGEVISAFNQMYQQVTAAITERRQVEAALRQSEEKFSKAFRASPSAIMISTLAEGRLIEVNDSFLQLYGGSLAEVIGQRSVDLNLWAAPEYWVEMVEQIRRAGAIYNREYTFRTQQGEPRFILFSAELINLDSEECLVSVANDITERKQAEEALERLAEIGELAAMIVHEVRNPLTTVMMGLNSLRSLALSEQSQLRLTLAVEEAERLQRLLNEILQYTRCQKLQAEQLELNALIQNMLTAIQEMPVAQSRQIEFTPGQPVCVLVDRDKLKQVFINLISNACEAIAVGETVSWKIEICFQQKLVYIQIYNQGEPIPPAVLANLTKPFFTTKSNGNGLGLAIVKRIVEAHRGTLLIESTAEIGGTQVTVILPSVSSSNTSPSDIPP